MTIDTNYSSVRLKVFCDDGPFAGQIVFADQNRVTNNQITLCAFDNAHMGYSLPPLTIALYHFVTETSVTVSNLPGIRTVKFGA